MFFVSKYPTGILMFALGSALSAHSAPLKKDIIQAVMYPVAAAEADGMSQVTLSSTNESGESLNVTVDSCGTFFTANFSFSTYSSDTTGFSSIYPSIPGSYAGGFLECSGYVSTLKSKSPDKATSKFSISELDVKLTQTLKPTKGGINLFQTYVFTNSSGNSVPLQVTRYHDIDLTVGGSFADDVGFSAGNDQVGAMETALNGGKKPVVLLSSDGDGFVSGWAVAHYIELSNGIAAESGSIPDSYIYAIQGDANNDGVADFGMDLAAATSRSAIVPPNGSVKITFKTTFALKKVP